MAGGYSQILTIHDTFSDQGKENDMSILPDALTQSIRRPKTKRRLRTNILAHPVVSTLKSQRILQPIAIFGSLLADREIE